MSDISPPLAPSRAPHAAARAAGPATAALPWLALLVAFSPLVPELWSDLGLGRKHHFIVLLAALLAFALARDPRLAMDPQRWPRAGLLALTAGLGLEMVGTAGGTSSLARLGLPIAWLGLAALRGAPSRRVVFLAFWLVPLPNALLELTSPGLEAALADLAAAAVRSCGGSVELRGISLLGHAGARLDLRPENGGLLLAHALGAVGWFLALLSGFGWRGCALRALRGYGLGLLLAPPALLVAAALVATGLPGPARTWLELGMPAAAAVIWIGCARCRTSPRRTLPMQPE